ncbi:hydantoinase/oxoprolinase family protein [Intrasporangium sp.]|uniref:hydantoinase/oxoprolinase family protein n=1 Tax=Intrasporangium sp. TaxID=1925024 RepID=UPI0032215C17
MNQTWNVSIDAGGTFTDAIAQSSTGAVLVAKVPSTPADPSQGLADAITELSTQGMAIDDVRLVCHGTTVATNATLTGAWAQVALVTTKGFRDVLAYRQGSRPDVYSLTPARPRELVARTHRLEVDERIDPRGKVLQALGDAEIDRVVAEVVALDPEAVAVSLLFSYIDDTHEAALGRALRAALPDTPVTLSSEVAREFREYPRTATTAMNAALRPIVGGYLRRASSAVAELGVEAPLLVMQSNGGCVPAERADAEAHKLVLSGPAGGVTGLVGLAARHGLDKTISLDMGGTSVDICLVRDGVTPMTTAQQIDDHTLLAPTVDIHTIGSGGGSIAWVDATGRLRVGPQSAKAVPGPVSYGRGGTEPTLTDAHVVLGTLGSATLASDLSLDREGAERALGELGEKLGMSATEAAEAIIAVSVAHMIRALRKVSVERGLDPREFTLVPFGGAGPLHAGLLLRHLGLAGVLIPERPGIFSAEGLVSAGLRFDDAQTVLRPFDPADVDGLLEWFTTSAEALVARLQEDEIPRERIEVAGTVDCRYMGQGFELNVPVELTRAGLLRLPEDFGDLHELRYGHANRTEPVEIVTLRVTATGHQGAATAQQLDEGTGTPDPAARIAERPVVIPGTGAAQQTPVWDRARLLAGDTIVGPAIVHQMDSTTVILGGQRLRVTPTGDMVLTEEKK